MKLHNTASGIIETFTPQDPSRVSIYTCGPTVYSDPLIGNWVAYIRWDLLVRVLTANGYTVHRVMNITDVGHLVSDQDEGEDKIEKGAKREGVTAWEVAERYTQSFVRGMTQLNLLPPEVLPKATDHIAEQISLIERLEAAGHTYVIDDGVYFDTSTFDRYADFGHLDLASMRAGARVELNTEKRNPSDFALWKFSPTGSTRDMEWDSPWGKGFPGWHIECSAMAIQYLGETLDIHTGGIDHIPVHHTNEIAQSEAATGKRFANYWLHANFLLANGTKISKSLGNGYTLGDLEEKGFTPLDFKLFVLQSHYRTQSNFTWEAIEAAANRLQHWRRVACLRHQVSELLFETDRVVSDAISTALTAKHAVLEALSDDLNSPAALSNIEHCIDVIEKAPLQELTKDALVDLFQYLDDVLGLRILDTTPDVTDAQKAVLRERQNARDEKQWQRSDELRELLGKEGIGLNDTTSGTLWYYL